MHRETLSHYHCEIRRAHSRARGPGLVRALLFMVALGGVSLGAACA